MTHAPHRHHLTSSMRAALRRARDQGLPLDCPGVHRRTLKALRERGLIDQRRNRKGRMMWRATELGHAALIDPQPPSFLHVRSQYGYTDRLEFAMLGEPESLRDAGDEREREQWLVMAA